MEVMERKKWGDTDEAGPATMTSRTLKVGMTDGWDKDGMEVNWEVGRKAGPATTTSGAVWV